LAIALALLTPVTLVLAPRMTVGQRAMASALTPAGAQLAVPAMAGRVVAAVLGETPVGTRLLMGWVGIAWAIGVVVFGTRLLGGWVTTGWVRRTAQTVAAARAPNVATFPGSSATAPSLLESNRVEAPVVVGWRRPAIILPQDAADQLPPDALEPLLAHELAHVIRQDYAVNVAQSLGDVLLFFSPGARWISSRVREAREYCCDDDAVMRCGGTTAYVRALAALAALGSRCRAHPLLGAVGPRLIVRIRRLLQVETTTRFLGPRVAGLVVALVGLVLSGVAVAGWSVENLSVPTLHGHDSSPELSAPSVGVAVTFVVAQPGSGVILASVTSTQTSLCGEAVIRNATDVAVVELSFVALVVHPDAPQTPVEVFSRDHVSVAVPARSDSRVLVNLLSPQEAVRLGAVQVTCALSGVQRADGTTWQITPNPVATTARDALSLPASGP
jgi:beta-lactamase regulating signal transducer with metallopeptidase domain